MRWWAPALIVLTVSLAVACGSSDSGGTLAAIKDRGTIVYGADVAGGEPYISEDPTDSHLVGFEVDIMDGLAHHLGVRPKMAQYAWENLVPTLERGDFDIVMNGLESTPQRQEELLLSEPYFTYAETLAVRKGSPYKTLDDLEGKRIGTLGQTVAEDILRDRKFDVAAYSGNIEPYVDLEQGRVDAVLLDNIIAQRYGCTAEHPTIVCLPDDVSRGTYVIGIRKTDPELLDAINNAIVTMRNDGELEAILRKAKLWDDRQTKAAPTTTSPTRDTSFGMEQLELFLIGALYTLAISVAAFLLAVPIGGLLAVGRVYGGPIVGALCRIYIELFRGTPVLLQLYVIYFGMSDIIKFGPIEAAILGLGLNYGAYEAEVYRGALLGIPRGQSEAAKALGLGKWQTLRHILLPQALRLALPPMTNDFVSLLKDSSLVGVIAVIELTKRMQITALDMGKWLVPGLLCAGLYLAMSLPLAELARRLERRLSRDQRPHTL